MVTVKPISTSRSDLRKFVKFGVDLYRDNPCYVPPLRTDDINTLTPSKNPAFDFCEAQSFMAYRDGKPVGRITGIINSVENERCNSRSMRFGFLDFIDDAEVADALFKAAGDWGRSKGMDSIVGPLGFTDMDHEGMLTFGYDEVGTMATIYNYPYYVDHMKRMGFEKEAEWHEFRMVVPPEVPEKYTRIAEIVKRRNNLRVLKYTSRKRVKKEYGEALFNLINEAYDKLYGYCPLTPRQIQYYIKMYLGILNLELLTLIVDEKDQLVGVGISIQSFSAALQKSRGRLFPFGWWHLLRALRGKSDGVDLLLIAVKPEYQNRGVNALLFTDLIPYFNKNHFKFAESNPELADNAKVQEQWQYFETRQHRRRCTWRKPL
ncbi:MAG: N-acetyltransferase [Muribaculaceae bacterium]|nr:N-acetyltransferase [Muribaculaceae bacterium]